jgi:DNA-binding phage protein
VSRPRAAWYLAPVAQGHPLVREMFCLLGRSDLSLAALADKAGLARGTMIRWVDTNSPTVMNLEAALNALGYELAIQRRGGGA